MKFRVVLVDNTVDTDHPDHRSEILVATVPAGEVQVCGIEIRGFRLPPITIKPGMDVVLRAEA